MQRTAVVLCPASVGSAPVADRAEGREGQPERDDKDAAPLSLVDPDPAEPQVEESGEHNHGGMHHLVHARASQLQPKDPEYEPAEVEHDCGRHDPAKGAPRDRPSDACQSRLGSMHEPGEATPPKATLAAPVAFLVDIVLPFRTTDTTKHASRIRCRGCFSGRGLARCSWEKSKLVGPSGSRRLCVCLSPLTAA